MIQYPISFKTSGSTAPGITSKWKVLSGDHRVECSIPPEFDGPGGSMSPEDLFAQALTNCFIATFKVIAEKSLLTFESLSVEGNLVVDKAESLRPVMKSFHFVIDLVGPSDKDRAIRLTEKAVKSGFILNSVKTQLSYDLKIS